MASKTGAAAVKAENEDKANAPKKERTVLTPEQKIAKLEAELAAAREKATEKAGKARATAMEKRASLVERIAKLQVQVDRIDAEFPPAEVEGTSTTVSEGDES